MTQPNELLTLWQATALRLTAFPSLEAAIDVSNWWQYLVGEPPDKESSLPKVQKRTQEGVLQTKDKAKLEFESQPGRVDWRYLPIETEDDLDGDSLTGTLTAIGPFPRALEGFLPLIRRWFSLESLPALSRLAFGAILRLPVADRASGYRQLATYLPYLNLDPEHTFSDLKYQINRPRPSTSSSQGLSINRLSKWSVREVHKQLFTLGPQGWHDAPSRPIQYACTLELDINTAQDFAGVLEPDTLPQLFNELVELGKEIAVKGDVP